MRPYGVILAGGAARRMGGGDKPLLPLAGRCVLDHVLQRLVPQLDVAALSANGDPARFSRFGLPVLADEVPGLGPLAGTLSGLRWARAVPWLLTVPGDTPFLPGDLAARLMREQGRTGRQIVHAASGGRDHPAVALISTGLADDLAAGLAAGTRAIRGWMAPFAPAVVEFSLEGGDPFLNINRPEDLVAAEERFKKSQS